MQAALQQLLDKQAITELVHAYCNAADRQDHDKLRQLYHPDAIDDHGGFFKGLAMDFIDRLPEIQAPMEILHHNITTLNIALDGDYAEAYCLWRPLAEQGYAEAQYHLGWLYANGNGLAVDIDRALGFWIGKQRT